MRFSTAKSATRSRRSDGSGRDSRALGRLAKVYFFTDETGNQTGGRYFIVAGVALEADLGAARAALRAIEDSKDGIGKRDWHTTKRPRVRCRYLCDALAIPALQGRAFWARFEGRRDHWQCTVEALQTAMFVFGKDKRCIVAHEGFTVSTRERLRVDLVRSLCTDFELRSGNFKGEPLTRFADRLSGGLGITHYGKTAHACALSCPFDEVVELTAS